MSDRTQMYTMENTRGIVEIIQWPRGGIIFITYLPLYPVDITHRIILSYSIVGIPTFCA
jgi:hypothetical protein